MGNFAHRIMTTIEPTDSPDRYVWEHGDYTGTVTFDGIRGPTRIEWDQTELPQNWEDIEDKIQNCR